MTKHIYGITAPMGSGKSTVLELLKKHGFETIDTDKLSKQLLIEHSSYIMKLFPECVSYEIINTKFEPVEYFDLKKYADIIFTNDTKRKMMEDFIYPLLFKKINKIINTTDNIIFIESAILFETNMDKVINFESVIYIWTDYALRIKKVLDNGKYNKTEFLQRENLQMSISKKMSLANVFLHNEYDIIKFEQELEKLLRQLKLK